MKLAEALNLRADISKRIAQLNQRLLENAKVQEGDTPAENPEEMLSELDALTNELESLIARINLTNSRITYEGKTITELIAKKDSLSLKNSVLRGFLSSASQKINNYSRSEIRVFSTVNVSELRKKSDDLAEEIRKLNVKLQELNWTNDLI